MMEVYILVKRYSVPDGQGSGEYDRAEIVDVYTSLELAVQHSGGRDWTYVDWDTGERAFSKGAYTEIDPDYSVYRFVMKSE